MSATAQPPGFAALAGTAPKYLQSPKGAPDRSSDLCPPWRFMGLCVPSRRLLQRGDLTILHIGSRLMVGVNVGHAALLQAQEFGFVFRCQNLCSPSSAARGPLWFAYCPMYRSGIPSSVSKQTCAMRTLG